MATLSQHIIEKYHLMKTIRSSGAWFMFTGTLFYIAENGLYTADHYMAQYSFGVHIVHPCFIVAQTLMVCGYLLREKEEASFPELSAARPTH